jgi:uncharacterized DUF497 family protein
VHRGGRSPPTADVELERVARSQSDGATLSSARCFGVASCVSSVAMTDISFDPTKRQATLGVRGLDLADAGRVFAGATYAMLDDRVTGPEQRFVTVGTLDGRVVVLVWAQRDGARHIISMRKASDREQALYAGRLD